MTNSEVDMDYSQLSDFEINKAVAISVGFPCYYGDGSYTNNLGLIGAIVKGKNTSGLFMVGEFNPCHNPTDAMQIIVGNSISLRAPRYKEGWTADFTGSDEDVNDGFEIDYFESRHQNPLRAAMIVFLMMQDANNV